MPKTRQKTLPKFDTQICVGLTDFLQNQVLSATSTPRFAGARARRVKRSVLTCYKRLANLWRNEPALILGIDPCLKALNELLFLISATQKQLSPHETHILRTRSHEQLYVLSAVARFSGANDRFSSLRRQLSRIDNCEERAIDERIRSLVRSLDAQARMRLVAKYLDELKRFQFHMKHPGQLPMVERDHFGSLSTLSKGEQDLCRRIVGETKPKHP